MIAGVILKVRGLPAVTFWVVGAPVPGWSSLQRMRGEVTSVMGSRVRWLAVVRTEDQSAVSPTAGKVSWKVSGMWGGMSVLRVQWRACRAAALTALAASARVMVVMSFMLRDCGQGLPRANRLMHK